MHRWKHILMLILMPILANAQIFSSKGRFSVEFDRGCTPMTVNITEHDSFGDVTRQYHFFEGAEITNSKSFTYQDPDTYQIVQIVGADGIDDKSDTLFVQAFASIKPEIEIQKCNGFEISVTSVDSYYDSIRVYFTPTDSATLLIDQSTSFTFSTNSNQTVGLKGFFNNADEVCNSFFEDVAPIPVLQAPEILEASIKESCKDVFTLTLQVDQIDTLTNYRINIVQSTSTKLYDGYLKNTMLTIQDIVFSQDNYCVNIEAYDPCNDVSQASADFCSESTDLSLSPFENLYSTYDSSDIFINLDQVQTGTFNVYRKLEDNEFEFRSEQTASFTDNIGSNGRRYFYQIEYVDSCGQVLYTAQTNPPLVEVSSIRTNEYEVAFTPPVNSLTEIPNNEYQSGTSFSQTTGEISQQEFNIQLDGKDGSPLQFITATSTYSDNLILKSNAITVRHELVIYVPTAFTPNGDGLNDTLEFLGLPTEVATINIYNRWGQLIYTSNQPTPSWDGTIGGSLAGQGTYLYEIIFETASGEKRTQKGTFALIKK